MTRKEKRNEIYTFICKQIEKKAAIEKWQEDMSRFLKEYAIIVLEDAEKYKSASITKEIQIKKTMPKILLTGKALKEKDIKNGVWRPDSHYGI